MLGEDVLQFLRERPIAMLCTRDGNNRPSAHECFLSAIAPDRVIAIVPRHVGLAVADNAADNGDAALLVSRAPGDHRSVQLKGKISAVEPARLRPEDRARLIDLVAPIFADYMGDAGSRALFEEMAAQPAFRVELEVREAFDQTPGPGAGRAIAEAPR